MLNYAGWSRDRSPEPAVGGDNAAGFCMACLARTECLPRGQRGLGWESLEPEQFQITEFCSVTAVLSPATGVWVRAGL